MTFSGSFSCLSQRALPIHAVEPPWIKTFFLTWIINRPDVSNVNFAREEPLNTIKHSECPGQGQTEGGVGNIAPETMKTLCRGVTSEIILAQTWLSGLCIGRSCSSPAESSNQLGGMNGSRLGVSRARRRIRHMAGCNPAVAAAASPLITQHN